MSLFVKRTKGHIEGEVGEVIDSFFDLFPEWEKENTELPIDGAQEAVEAIKENALICAAPLKRWRDEQWLISIGMIYGYMKGRASR